MSTHATTLTEYAMPTCCTRCGREEDGQQFAEVGEYDLSCSPECTAQLCYEASTASGKKAMRMLAAALYLLQEVQLERIPLEAYELDTAVIRDEQGVPKRFPCVHELREDAMAMLDQFGASDTAWQEAIWADVEELTEKLGGVL